MKNFKLLVDNISSIHTSLQQQAASAVNQSLTIRNWLIGHYIVEYEQNGEDRAEYGSMLEKHLARNIDQKGLSERNLKLFKQFYLTYPQIGQTLSDFSHSLPAPISIMQTVSAQSSKLQVPPDKILKKLSFSHLTELLKVHDTLKRTFYEIECIKGTWSVRELKRQIGSLYYERSGLSAKPEKLSEIVQERTTPQSPIDIIKNVYAFEFLEIRAQDAVEESDLEAALLNNLQAFIIELGNGFCFELCKNGDQ